MKVAIIGLGLIGGSWGLALREWAKTEGGRAADLEIVGFDAKGSQRTLADKMGICHRYTATPMGAVKGAQLVIVATPVMAVRDTFEDIAEHLSPGAVITDTCSTKRQVMKWAKELLPSTVHFVGGHPMAGKTASLEEAVPHLFKDCTYCITSDPVADEEAVATVTRLVEVLGANPYFIDAAEHDSYVAAISHVPYLATVGLVNLVGNSEGWREMARLASTGFQDTTRLAGGSLQMHLDICRTNSDSIISWLDRYQAQLTQLRGLIAAGGLFDEQARPQPEALSDPSGLEEVLGQAKTTRERWMSGRARPNAERDSQNFMPSKEDLKPEYGRIFFGGVFAKKKRPDDSNSSKP